VRSHGGASWSGRNSMNPFWWELMVVPHGYDVIPQRFHGGASLYNLVRIQVRIASWNSKESMSLT